jgi:indoleamine 2,3-dioxygenase
MAFTLRRSLVQTAKFTRTVSNLPQFTVGCHNGFLPRQVPLAELPAPFEKLESLLQRMPIKCRDGSPGLLAQEKFGDTLMAELPDYTAEVEACTDNQLLAALFRDYTFAASSYLLEPCRKWTNCW